MGLELETGVRELAAQELRKLANQILAGTEKQGPTATSMSVQSWDGTFVMHWGLKTNKAPNRSWGP